MRIQKVLFSVLIGLASVTVSAAGDYQAGKVKAYTCTGCHGIVDYKNTYPSYRVPRIAGQNREYVISVLQAYKSGERKHKTMNLQAESLSDQDIEDIAAYVSTLTNYLVSE